MNRRGFIGKALMSIAAVPLVRVIAKSDPVSTVSRRANAPRGRLYRVNYDAPEFFFPKVSGQILTENPYIPSEYKRQLSSLTNEARTTGSSIESLVTTLESFLEV